MRNIPNRFLRFVILKRIINILLKPIGNKHNWDAVKVVLDGIYFTLSQKYIFETHVVPSAYEGEGTESLPVFAYTHAHFLTAWLPGLR